MSGEHATNLLCETLVVSRSGYYQWRDEASRPRHVRNRELLAAIHAVHLRSRATYGSPRITRCLREQRQRVGRNRVARLMRLAGLEGRTKKRYRVRTTDSNHSQPIAPNRLAKQPRPTKPNQIWVTDLTYVATDEGWLYLAGVLDLYSRRIVGWAMGPSLETTLPVQALQMALRQRRPAPGLIHHSDRGVQYASTQYRDQLARHGLIASMSRKANCYDNATMEAFWSTLKNELVYRQHFLTRAQARTAIFDFIEGFYNRSRLHSALGYLSPLDFEVAQN